MAARDDASAFDLGPARHCGAYTPGHEVHYIQARKSREAGLGTAATVTAVDDDGTITFANGSTKWNHEARRLRDALDHHGPGVQLCDFGVLRVPNGNGAHLFCVGDEPTPCPGPARAPTSLDDVVRQAKERGGFLISGPELLRLAAERRERHERL